MRIIAKKFDYISLIDLKHFIQSEIHEYRNFCLICLVNIHQSTWKTYQKNVFNAKMHLNAYKGLHNIINFYIDNVHYINNWDLVDISCYKIIGHYILYFFINKNNTMDKYGEDLVNLLKEYVLSENIWKRRIAIVSTLYLIKQNHLDLSVEFATKLLSDKHDLIHKASGWMLREVGKKTQTFWKIFRKNSIRKCLERC